MRILPHRGPGALSLLPLLLFLIGPCGCQGGGAPGGEAPPSGKGRRGPAADAGAAAPVEVIRLELGPISDGIESTATVEARMVAALRAGTSGTLGLFTLDEGSPVTAGQLLVRIDRPGATGALTMARSQVAKARADARALQKLGAEGLVPGQQLEDAQFNLRQAELEVARLGEERDLEKVLSPINGVITTRYARPGEAVSAGAVLFDVADLSALEAQLRIPERHLARLRPGMAVEVTAEGVGDHRRLATVDRIAPVVDPASGTIKVAVALGDGTVPGGPHLRPGMYIRARVVIDTREQAVRVPKRALVREDDRVFVFRVANTEGEGAVEKVPVAVGYADRDVVEAREGLAAGDAVVVFGQRGLADGARVRVVLAPPEAGALPAAASPDGAPPTGAPPTGAPPTGAPPTGG